MNTALTIADLLLIEHSKANTLRIENHIGTDEDLFDELMQNYFSKEIVIAQRAAWVVQHCFKSHPFLLSTYIDMIIPHIQQPNLHDATLRCSLQILSFIELSEDQYGQLLDFCFTLFTNNEFPVAIQVHAMQIIFNSTSFYPELKNELKILIEDKLHFASAGMISRGRKLLKQLS